jgi:ribosomal protein S18 acetylase RimI-like enzyme
MTPDTSMKQDADVRKATSDHVASMAHCHAASFPEYFLTAMGEQVLRAIYAFYVKHDKGIVWVAETPDGQVVGVVLGGEPNLRTQWMKYVLLKAGPSIVWKVLVNSRIRDRLTGYASGLLKSFLFNRQKTARHQGPQPPPSAPAAAPMKRVSLVSICVLPEHRGLGIGGRLIEAFREDCAQAGYDTVTLTVKAENSVARSFYKRHGWQKVGEVGGSVELRIAAVR